MPKPCENSKIFSSREETANILTHGLGVALGLVGTVIPLIFSVSIANIWRTVGFSVYGTTLITCFTVSTLYHCFRKSSVKRIFQILDHSSIFLLIAGTYTPFLLVSLRGSWGWPLFGVIWGIAALGIIYKALFIDRYPKMEAAIYIVMGWISILALKQLTTAIGLGGIMWLLSGGIIYTVGIIFHRAYKFPYHHAVWHIFVLGGAACHYMAILLYVLPK